MLPNTDQIKPFIEKLLYTSSTKQVDKWTEESVKIALEKIGLLQEHCNNVSKDIKKDLILNLITNQFTDINIFYLLIKFIGLYQNETNTESEYFFKVHVINLKL